MKRHISYFVLIACFAVAAAVLGMFAYQAILTDYSLVTTLDHSKATEVSRPVTLSIPKLGVTAEIEEVGVTKDGEMDVPKDVTAAGWYKHGTLPGAAGSAVIAGHLDNYLGEPLIFARLGELVEGDDVFVMNEQGEELHFRVVKKETYPYDMTDTSAIFGPADSARLNLITCEGTWVQSEQSYNERTVVFTERI